MRNRLCGEGCNNYRQPSLAIIKDSRWEDNSWYQRPVTKPSLQGKAVQKNRINYPKFKPWKLLKVNTEKNFV